MIWLSLTIAAPFLLCLFALFVAWAVKRGREVVGPRPKGSK